MISIDVIQRSAQILLLDFDGYYWVISVHENTQLKPVIPDYDWSIFGVWVMMKTLLTSQCINQRGSRSPCGHGDLSCQTSNPNRHYFPHDYLANGFITSRLIRSLSGRKSNANHQPGPPQLSYIKSNIFHPD